MLAGGQTETGVLDVRGHLRREIAAQAFAVKHLPGQHMEHLNAAGQGIGTQRHRHDQHRHPGGLANGRVLCFVLQRQLQTDGDAAGQHDLPCLQRQCREHHQQNKETQSKVGQRPGVGGTFKVQPLRQKHRRHVEEWHCQRAPAGDPGGLASPGEEDAAEQPIDQQDRGKSRRSRMREQVVHHQFDDQKQRYATEAHPVEAAHIPPALIPQHPVENL